MNRNKFLQSSAFMLGAALWPQHILAAEKSPVENELPAPFLLSPLPPLQHNGGLNVRTWVRSSMTGGVYSNVECAVAPKTMGPPPHHHKELDELMYVVEGTASVLVKDEVVEVKAGGWHFRPRMITHTFWNASTEPLRFFDMYFNQPFEEYLEKIFFEINEKNGYPEGSEKKNTAMAALNAKFGVEFGSTAFEEYDKIKRKYALK